MTPKETETDQRIIAVLVDNEPGVLARVIGLFETSWALALLVGAPVAAALIGGFGWRDRSPRWPSGR